MNVMKSKNPFELEPDAAIELITQQLQTAAVSQHHLYLRERGQIYLFLGNTHLARTDFDTLIQLVSAMHQTKTRHLQSDHEYNLIGITYWMEGHRELALSFWRCSAEAFLSGRVQYSIKGSGIGTALLLWFGAVQLKREDDLALVKAICERRIQKHPFLSNDPWDFAIAKFILGELNDLELFERASEDRSALSEANFVVAVRARSSRRFAAYKKHMKAAAPADDGLKSVQSYYNLNTFFIARFESGGDT